jgi:hypothetical protein
MVEASASQPPESNDESFWTSTLSRESLRAPSPISHPANLIQSGLTDWKRRIPWLAFSDDEL